MKVLVFLFVIFSSSYATKLIATSEIEYLFHKALSSRLTDFEHNRLKDVIEILRAPEHISARKWDYGSITRNTLDCIICRSAFGALFTSVRNGQSDHSLSSVIGSLCYSLGIENERVCRGAVSLNMPILSYIIRNQPAATPNAFCSLVLQNSGGDICPAFDPRFDWTVELPKPMYHIPLTATAEQTPLTVAIITDAHLDPLYEAGGVANCGEPVCCRKGQKAAKNAYSLDTDEAVIKKSIVDEYGEKKLDLNIVPEIRRMRQMPRRSSFANVENSPPAGYWGDYRNCDTPLWAYDDLIDRIAEEHKKIDVIYYIGDTIDHGVWETTYDTINEMNKYLIEKLQTNFGTTPVIPAIGNHESQPTNQFAPMGLLTAEVNTTWLYEALARKWEPYLDPEAQRSLLQRGDFSMLVKPGLRAISLNNNVAYRNNWWIVYDPTDQKKHLEWLINELDKAEKAGEKVHILAHIPPGAHDLTYTWTREYNRIVNRFSTTIAAEFNGHTHSDEFKVFYDPGGMAINVAWGGGSATTYSNYNLNYKIATFHHETHQPTSIVNYVYNLTEANLTPNRRPHWFSLYDMKNTFAMSDLTAPAVDNLVKRMVTTDMQLLDLYAAFFSKLSDPRWQSCSRDCKLDLACRTVTTVLWDQRKCEELRQLHASGNILMADFRKGFNQ